MSSTKGFNQGALNRWNKARTPYGYLRSYILNKPVTHSYHLTLIDLVLVSNFKGGSATIAEPQDSLDQKLKSYSQKLSHIGCEFGKKSLSILKDRELTELILLASGFCELSKSTDAKINGFGPSFATALLNVNFPKLLPILDKRGLNGADIKNVKTNSQGQVLGIESHYPDLIRYFYKRTNEDSMTVEEIDKEIFGFELAEKYKPKNQRKSNE